MRLDEAGADEEVEADDERGWRLDIKIRSGHSPNYDLLAFLPSRIIVKKCNLLQTHNWVSVVLMVSWDAHRQQHLEQHT